MSIEPFTRPQSYTVTFSQYIAFPKIYILYYSIQMSCLTVKLIHFSYADSRGIYEIIHIISFCLLSMFYFFILYPQVRYGEKNFKFSQLII
jgi:hypothetical protein